MLFFLLIWCKVTLVKVLSIKMHCLGGNRRAVEFDFTKESPRWQRQPLRPKSSSPWQLHGALKVLNILDPKIDGWTTQHGQGKSGALQFFGHLHPTQIPQQKCQWILLILLLQWKLQYGYGRDTLPKTNIAPENWYLEDYFPPLGFCFGHVLAYFQGIS